MGLEVLYGVGTLALLAALIWGTMQWRRRSATAETVGESATRRNYEAEDRRAKSPRSP